MSNIVVANRSGAVARPGLRALAARRELILRSSDGICFITVAVWWHRLAAAAAIALIAGVGLLAWQFQTTQQRLAVNDVEIVQVADAYQATIQHLEGSISQLEVSVADARQMATRAQETARDEAQRRSAALAALNAENEGLRRRVDTMRSELDTARAEAAARAEAIARAEAEAAARPRMPVVIRGGERSVELQETVIERLRSLETQMRTVGRGNAQVSGAAAVLQRQIEDLEAVARAVPRPIGAGEEVAIPVPEPGMRVIEIAPASGTPTQNPDMSAAEPDGDPLQLARDQAHLGVQMVSALVRRTGVNPDQALAMGVASAEPADAGGPFMPLRAAIDAGLFQMQSDLSHYGATAGRLADLMRLVRSMPLGRPLPEYEVTSGFGARRDPFNGLPALHNGVDLRAMAGTPVTATAPGVVTMAETNGEFGNLIEIAHGFGLRTRYGHLSRVLVARGDRIEAGQTIGQVGSTGRSTGPHLHYEILFRQANLDPLKFLEVSRHVLANVQRRFE